MTDPREAIALKPCPFCGSDKVISGMTQGRRFVMCECDAEGPTGDTPAKAITAWNTRADAIIAARPAVDAEVVRRPAPRSRSPHHADGRRKMSGEMSLRVTRGDLRFEANLIDGNRLRWRVRFTKGWRRFFPFGWRVGTFAEMNAARHAFVRGQRGEHDD